MRDIDISPLIDVVFILLIFFMVSTTFVKDLKLDLQRPGAASSERAGSKVIRVHLDKHENLYVEGNPVKGWMLQSRVRDALRSGVSQSVLVITDARVSAERLINVVDQCRLAGAADVGVATEEESG
jgi:biopolymer transport protein ExbD